MTIIAIECRIVFVVVIEIVLFVNFLPPRSKEGTKCLQWIFFIFVSLISVSGIYQKAPS